MHKFCQQALLPSKIGNFGKMNEFDDDDAWAVACAIDALEFKTRGIIIEICAVMKENGVESVNVSALLTLLGVPRDKVQAEENEYFDLSGPEFALELEEWRQTKQLIDLDGAEEGETVH